MSIERPRTQYYCVLYGLSMDMSCTRTIWLLCPAVQLWGRYILAIQLLCPALELCRWYVLHWNYTASVSCRRTTGVIHPAVKLHSLCVLQYNYAADTSCLEYEAAVCCSLTMWVPTQDTALTPAKFIGWVICVLHYVLLALKTLGLLLYINILQLRIIDNMQYLTLKISKDRTTWCWSILGVTTRDGLWSKSLCIHWCKWQHASRREWTH
jgi:hypothetical protein